MTPGFAVTRRRAMALLTGLIGFAGAARATAEVATKIDDDAELIRLGRQFEAIAERIDFAIDHSGPGHSYYDQTLTDAIADYGVVYDRISALRATTTAGLSVKARIVTWASAGKMHPEDSAILIDPIALSLAEDLLKVASQQSAAEA